MGMRGFSDVCRNDPLPILIVPLLVEHARGATDMSGQIAVNESRTFSSGMDRPTEARDHTASAGARH